MMTERLYVEAINDYFLNHNKDAMSEADFYARQLSNNNPMYRGLTRAELYRECKNAIAE